MGRRICWVVLAALVILLAWNPRAVAAENEPKKWMVQYRGTDGRLVVDLFRRSSDGWQDLTQSRLFQSSSELLEFFENNTDSMLISADPEYQDLVDFEERESSEGPFFSEGRELRGPRATAVLWNATASWDKSWEQKFSDWIRTDVDAKFFQSHGLATDCADVLYALRWIFARQNKLEMASRLSGSGAYFTHRSLRGSWANLPTATNWYEDKRFRAALNYLLENTYTHSLMADSYPIEISKGAVDAGVYHLDLHRQSGHAQIVYRTDASPNVLLPFLIFQSTIPRLVRELSVQGFWYSHQPLENKGGLLRMRWPKFGGSSVNLIPAAQMPFYSREQYAADFLRMPNFPYNQEVYLRLNPDLDFNRVVEDAYQNLVSLLRERVKVVDDGYRACANRGCPPNSSVYEDWSTPTRDGRLTELYRQTKLLQSTFGIPDPAFVRQTVIEIENVSYSVLFLLKMWEHQIFSSDPNDLPQKRWGVSAAAVAAWGLESLNYAGAERAKNLSARLDTSSVDGVFIHVQTVFQSYCSEAPEQSCFELRDHEKNQKMKLGNEELSFRDWLNRISWFVSKPDVGTTYQWGAHSKNFVWFGLNHPGEKTFAGDWVLSRHARLGWQLGQRRLGGGEWVRQGSALDTVFLAEDPDQKSAAYLVSSSGMNLNIENLESGAAETISVGFRPLHFLQIGKTLFLRGENRDYILLNRGQTSWEILAQGKFVWSSQMKKHRAIALGEETQARVWDLSGEHPISIVVPLLESHQIRANTERWIAFERGLLLDKKTHQIMQSSELFRVLTCHISGDSCLLVDPKESMTFDFVRVAPNGQVTLVRKIKGLLMEKETGVITFSPDGSSRAFRWESDQMVEIASPASDEFITNIFGSFLLTRNLNGRMRLYRGRSLLFEHQGSMWISGLSANGEAYVGLMQQTGYRSFLSTDKPTQELGTLIRSSERNDLQAEESGALIGGSLWIQ